MARRPAPVTARIDLIRAMELLQMHLTGTLCRTVFRHVRISERQRVRTREALVRFWTVTRQCAVMRAQTIQLTADRSLAGAAGHQRSWSLY